MKRLLLILICFTVDAYAQKPDDLPYVWPVRSQAVIAAERRKAESEGRRRQRAHERMELEAERLHRKRSRAAKKAWRTRRQNSTLPMRGGPDTATDQ